ncbi:flavin reductase family protein [Lacticaseibacillus daqingensis]|uniref:flavin reductase family protein n=1 Tax=Lacticaseibacillus daqingensis TaxID=2486014 RepID=UPI0013DE3ADD|nr:flavin reductase [Lacticaseibacillus daqingensis]
MLIPYQTTKLYVAYPIFIIGYEDVQFGANLTTCSSSYSLGTTFGFGLGQTGHAAAQIQRTKRCTINFLSPYHLDWIEYAGFHHATEKLTSSHIPYRLEAGCPVLTDAFAVLTLTITSWQPLGGAIHFLATIQKRQVQADQILDGRLDVTALTPPLFAGDGHQRVYRTLAPQVSQLGDHLAK